MRNVRPEVAIGLSTRNIMLLTALAMVALALPLGTEYIFSGHGQRYLPSSATFDTDTFLLWSYFVLDSLIGLSYVAISLTLGYLAWRARKDIPFLWMFVAFGAFIVACGFTHLVAVWTLWQPMYYLSGGVMFITAVASVATAVVLPRLIPKALELIENAKTASLRKAELERLNAQLKAQKAELTLLNQTKDEFISLASHQLRTPATGVKQYVGMVLQGYFAEDPKKQLSLLRKAYESNNRQIEIINDLLNVAQLDAGKVVLKKQRINITKLVNDIISEQADTFKDRRQQIKFKAPAKAIKARVDCDRMRMVIENLISNASKYTPEGKEVTISLEKGSEETVRLTITDQGVGISQKDQLKLFKKFSRIDNPLTNQVGGSGLGLYWAKKIVDLHDAQLNVRSKLHRGSTFEVILPV